MKQQELEHLDDRVNKLQGWRLNGRCAILTFAHSLHGVDLGVVFHGVDCEINLRNWLLILDRANSIVDLLVPALLSRGLLSFGVHDGGLSGAVRLLREAGCGKALRAQNVAVVGRRERERPPGTLQSMLELRA